MNEKVQPNQDAGGEAIPAKGSTERPEAIKIPGTENLGGDKPNAENEVGLSAPRMRINEGILYVEVPLRNKDINWVCGWLQYTLIPWAQLQFYKAQQAQIERQSKIVRPSGQPFLNGLRNMLRRK